MIEFLKHVGYLCGGLLKGALIALAFWMVVIVFILVSVSLCTPAEASTAMPTREATLSEQDRSVLGNNSVYTYEFIEPMDSPYVPRHIIYSVCKEYCVAEVDRRIEVEHTRLTKEVKILEQLIELLQMKHEWLRGQEQ